MSGQVLMAPRLAAVRVEKLRESGRDRAPGMGETHPRVDNLWFVRCLDRLSLSFCLLLTTSLDFSSRFSSRFNLSSSISLLRERHDEHWPFSWTGDMTLLGGWMREKRKTWSILFLGLLMSLSLSLNCTLFARLIDGRGFLKKIIFS